MALATRGSWHSRWGSPPRCSTPSRSGSPPSRSRCSPAARRRGSRSARAGCASAARLSARRVIEDEPLEVIARRPRGHAAAPDRAARRPAARRAGRARDRAPPVAHPHRGALRPPRPSHAGGAEDRRLRPALARDAHRDRRRRRTGRTRCSCCRASSRSARPADGDDDRSRARGREVATAEVDVDGLRPLREGTSAARIYWPAVARGAEPMERRLAGEGDGRPLVVLDPRGAADARGPRRGRARDRVARRAPRAQGRLLACSCPATAARRSSTRRSPAGRTCTRASPSCPTTGASSSAACPAAAVTSSS